MKSISLLIPAAPIASHLLHGSAIDWLSKEGRTMAYDEGAAQRVRELVGGREGFSERKMFGGVCFMLNGNMFAGVIKNELMLKVGKPAFEDALAQPHARPMDFTGRPMIGMVYVAPPGFETKQALQAWLDRALSVVDEMPAKQPKASKPRPRA